MGNSKQEQAADAARDYIYHFGVPDAIDDLEWFTKAWVLIKWKHDFAGDYRAAVIDALDREVELRLEGGNNE